MKWLWQKLFGTAARRPSPMYFQTPRIVSETEQKRANLERLLALGGISDADPIWKTVLSYADEHARNEQESALKPDLVNDARQYNAGRAASALDFATALRDLRTQAILEARKLTKKDE